MKELNNIYLEDCISFMKKIEAESVDLIIADPPYNLKKNFGNNSDLSGTVLVISSKEGLTMPRLPGDVGR